MDDLDLPGRPSTQDDISLARALVNLGRRRDFRVHLFIYIAWSLFLGVVWIVTEHERTGTWPKPFSDNPESNWNPWIAYAVFGWGLIVAFHAFVTYRRPVTPNDLQEELRRLRGEA